MSEQQTENNVWCPPLSPKQLEVFNCGIECEASLFPSIPVCLLVAGSRFSGKTVASLHRVCRHLWETPGARVAMFAKFMKNLTDGGSFVDLIHTVIPMWVESGIGFEFTTFDSASRPGPKNDAKTRTTYFRVRNMYGGESELRLFSLANDAEVEGRLKNLSFSMIYFSELTNFGNHCLLRSAIWQLRMQHLRPWQHMFLADTNPSDEGDDSWVYKYWYKRRAIDGGDEKQKAFLQSLKLIEIFMEDNTFMTEEQREYYRSMYADDPGDYDRDILGRWVKGHGTKGKHFADLYTPAVHVIGGGEDEEDTIEVAPSTETLYTGWDIGSSVNHAAVILEERLHKIEDKEISTWIAHDELVSIGERIQLEDFVPQFLEKMREIEKRSGKKFIWEHWADDSALNVFRNTGAGTDALEVQIHSHGEIILMGIEKPAGSVRSRVKIMRKLLRQRRFYHAARCVKIAQMFYECRQGSAAKDYIAWDENKHVIDALSYPIFKKNGWELVDQVYRPVATEKTDEDSVSIELAPGF